MPSLITYDTIRIVSDSYLEDFHLSLNWQNVKKLHIDIQDGWPLSCLENFNGNLKEKAPNLEELILIGFSDWDITSLPSSLINLHLECRDGSLELLNLNLIELTRIKKYTFDKDGVTYSGSMPEHLPKSAEKHDLGENDNEHYSEDQISADAANTLLFFASGHSPALGENRHIESEQNDISL